MPAAPFTRYGHDTVVPQTEHGMPCACPDSVAPLSACRVFSGRPTPLVGPWHNVAHAVAPREACSSGFRGICEWHATCFNHGLMSLHGVSTSASLIAAGFAPTRRAFVACGGSGGAEGSAGDSTLHAPVGDDVGGSDWTFDGDEAVPKPTSDGPIGTRGTAGGSGYAAGGMRAVGAGFAQLLTDAPQTGHEWAIHTWMGHVTRP